MNRTRSLWWRLVAVMALVFAVGVSGGCEEDEDETEVTTGMNGSGTLDEPYLIQSGVIYEDVPIEKGGTLFFIALQVPAGWNALSTSTAVDIDLGVGGFYDYFGDGVGGSANADTGNESFGVLGDGVVDLYFQVAGNKVRTDSATFDISILPTGTAPAAISVTSLAACPAAAPPPPSTMCDLSGSHMTELDLGFAVAPAAPLSIAISGPTPNPAFFRTTECAFSGCGTIPFPENGGNNYGSGSGGFCHKNLGTAGNPGTCTVNPVTGYDAPQRIRIVNNWSTTQDLTVSFSTP